MWGKRNEEGRLSPEESLDEVAGKGVDGTADEEDEEEAAATAEQAPPVVAADHEAAGLPGIAEPGEGRVRPARTEEIGALKC